MSIETVIYPFVCEQLGWPPRTWMGKNGVAAHLAELDGEVRNLQHYFIPHPHATVSRIDDRRHIVA